MKFLDHTQRHHTRWESSERVIGPLQSPLCGKTKHSRETSMPSAGFEPAIPASERP